MIKYEQKELFISVKWKKQEIGRIYFENNKFHYRPRGCSGVIRSEEFPNITQMKKYLEGR